MVNQPQGHNSMDSSAALLQQQQHNFDVQVSVIHFYIFQIFIAINIEQIDAHIKLIEQCIGRSADKTNKNSAQLLFCKISRAIHRYKRVPIHFANGREIKNNQIEPQTPNT